MLAHSKIHVVQELSLKEIQIVFKICDVKILIFDFRNLALVIKSVEGGISQEGDYRNKELRANHVHLRILVGNIYNAGVVIVIIFFKHGNQNRIFTELFGSVLIQLFKKVFIFFLGRCSVGLVFHFKHNRNKLNAVRAGLAENKISLTARSL